MQRRTRLLTLGLAIAVAALPIIAAAQGAPAASDEETITGHIASIDDAGNLDLNDDRGFVDSVQLGQATIVRPSGLRLAPGMAVTIAGYNRGSVFAADHIDIAQQSLPPQAVPPQSAYAPAPPQNGPRPQNGEALPPRLRYAGDLSGVLDTPVDSKTGYAGEPVTLSGVSSADGSIRNASMSGTVAEVTRPGQGRNAQILLHIDTLHVRDGATFQVDGIVTAMQVATKSNALKEVGGALAGMLIGNAIGKTAFGISGGGVAGAVGGYFIAKDNRADVVVPANTGIIVHLVSARRQSS